MEEDAGVGHDAPIRIRLPPADLWHFHDSYKEAVVCRRGEGDLGIGEKEKGKSEEDR